MKIACNDSNELRELIDEGKIDIDLIKWPSLSPNIWPLSKSLLSKKPLLIHGFMGSVDYYIGNTIDFSKIDWEKVEQLESICSSEYYSCHIGGLASKIQGIDWNGIDCSKDDEKKILNQSIDNLKEIKKIFKKPVIIENIPIFQNCDNSNLNFPRCVGKPDFISTLIQEANVDFLLDIAHARVSASALGMDIYEYLDKLPLDRIVEIHVSGVKDSKLNQLVDFHCEMDETDIDLLIYVISKTDKLQVITHEFTPLDKDFYLLDEKITGKKPYETITADGVNQKAKQLLKRDLLALQVIRDNYIERISYTKNQKK